MSRSLFKGFINKKYLVTFIKQLSQKKNKKSLFIKHKNQIIVPQLVGQNLSIYNGKKIVSLFITNLMVGYKLGEFISTRANFKFVKKKKIKKKGKK